jgi:hypothetical protein
VLTPYFLPNKEIVAMTARNRSRRLVAGFAAVALLAPLAVVAALASPASALPGKPHEVYMYKVEKHVDLSGEFPDQNMHEHVYCNPGDIALDGMWRVDHVDQANPPDTFGDERDVYFLASYGDDADRTEWHFRATNYADGDAQVKLFVTCIRGNVEQAFGHTHQVRISNRYDDGSHSALPAGTYEWDSFGNVCAPDEYAVAPGFNVTSSVYGKRIRLFRNWPTSNFRGWHWAFVVEDPVDISVYIRCLRTTTSASGNGPHAHELPMTWRSNGYGGVYNHLNVTGTQERRLNCDDGANGNFYQDYKAMVGAFWIDDPHHVWYLGMDPRPKQRAYKFWWDHSGGDGVYLAALCIRARTGKQIAPVP